MWIHENKRKKEEIKGGKKAETREELNRERVRKMRGKNTRKE